MNPIPMTDFPTNFPVIAPTGELLGYVDDLNKGPDKIAVAGWTVADEVGICSATLRVSTVPTVDRYDVSEIHPGLITQDRGVRLGFHVKADANDDMTYLFLRIGQETHYVYIGS